MTTLSVLFILDSILLIFLMLTVGILIYKLKVSRLLDYIVALVLTAGISEMIKYYVNKPRPISDFVFEGSAFPSTHAATAACVIFFYLLVCHSLPKSLGGVGEAIAKNFFTRDGVIALFIILLGLMVAWLRVLLSAHDYIDVFAGIILGLSISIVFVLYDISGRRVR